MSRDVPVACTKYNIVRCGCDTECFSFLYATSRLDNMNSLLYDVEYYPQIFILQLIRKCYTLILNKDLTLTNDSVDKIRSVTTSGNTFTTLHNVTQYDVIGCRQEPQHPLTPFT